MSASKGSITKASPEEAKEIWDGLANPSPSEVEAELARRGRPTPRRTIGRWKAAGWTRDGTGRPTVDIPALEEAPKVIERGPVHEDDAAIEVACNAKTDAELVAYAARRVLTMVTVVADVVTNNAKALVALEPKGLGVLIKAIAGGLAEGQAQHDRLLALAGVTPDKTQTARVIDANDPLADVLFAYGLKRMAKDHGVTADIENAAS